MNLAVEGTVYLCKLNGQIINTQTVVYEVKKTQTKTYKTMTFIGTIYDIYWKTFRKCTTTLFQCINNLHINKYSLYFILKHNRKKTCPSVACKADMMETCWYV